MGLKAFKPLHWLYNILHYRELKHNENPYRRYHITRPDNEQIRSILSFILDKDVVPFQTINFITGSEQKAHSDSIHMTTYPLGYLIALWIALEDIAHSNGTSVLLSW